MLTRNAAQLLLLCLAACKGGVEGTLDLATPSPDSAQPSDGGAVAKDLAMAAVPCRKPVGCGKEGGPYCCAEPSEAVPNPGTGTCSYVKCAPPRFTLCANNSHCAGQDPPVRCCTKGGNPANCGAEDVLCWCGTPFGEVTCLPPG